MYDVHLGLIGKCVVDFLLVLTELFLLGVTAEAPRAKEIENRRFCSNTDIGPKISGRRGRPSPQWMLYNVAADSCIRFSSREVQFYVENGRFAFFSPLWRA